MVSSNKIQSKNVITMLISPPNFPQVITTSHSSLQFQRTTMLRCFSLTSPPNHLPSSSSSDETTVEKKKKNKASTSSNTPPLQSDSTKSSSTPSVHPSPSPPHISLSHEFSQALQTTSYNEILSKFHNLPDHQLSHLVILSPSPELVQRALHHSKPTTFTCLISTYFQHSEHTCRQLYLLLHDTLTTARSFYSPLHTLLSILPSDPSLLSQPQCDTAFQTFHQFHLHHNHNPFPNPTSHNFQHLRLSFSQLKHNLDRRLRKARRKTHLFKTASSTLCFTAPLHLSLSSKFINKQIRLIAQLDAAAKGAYVLNNDLDTIDRLVARLHGLVESDKLLVGFWLERGRERFPTQEVVKELRKNQKNFIYQLKALEEHVCVCFTTINRARSLLLQEIHHQQATTSNS